MDRSSVLLAGLNESMLGLEIGAGFKPIARKAAGWNVKVVDHATRQELREKYQGQPQVDIDGIEEVDIVWSARALHDCVRPEQHRTFDYCLASHVIEHIPDLLTFFHSMEVLLSPSGVLSLAVPDKRFCFDAFKPISTTADVLHAHMQRHRATRHSGKTRFENIAYNVTSSENRCWDQRVLNELGIFSKLAEAQQVFDPVAEEPASPYLDCHAWYFTPSSFQLLIAELRALGRTRLLIEHLSPSQGSEFLVRMRLESHSPGAHPQPSEDERMALMIAILAEQTQQYNLIGEPLRQRMFQLLPEGHPLPNVNPANEILDKILNSYSWRLISAFWTGIDRLKRTLKLPGA